ncbi:hypothetical protein OC842_004357 [Tilletia horrida]|uniref:SGF29 C-terminal domain-containing protein n=1 Tax=Tilletia horrida TaxID=155126 RepID=A0AAN6JJD5_9BASI|nr:hypothetical protein OC842_004357 [Tilletia horrida]
MAPRKDRQANQPSASLHQASSLGGPQADESVEQQLWYKIRAQLRTLEQLRPTAERTLREIDRLQAQLAAPAPQASRDAAKAKGLNPDLVGAEDKFKDNERILKLCEEAAVTGEAEEGAIDSAIEQLSILIALASAPPDVADSKRKKRRTDASPPRGSLSPSSRNTPLPGSGANTPIPSHLYESSSSHAPLRPSSLSGLAAAASTSALENSQALFTSTSAAATGSAGTGGTVKGSSGAAMAGGGTATTTMTMTTQTEGKRKGTAKSRRATASSSGTTHDPRGSSPISAFSGATTAGSGGAGGGAGTTANTPLGGEGREYVDPARARREVLAHQLPLRKGRRVAFRQPTKRNPGPGGQQPIVTEGEDGETWIMATVEECINNDRNRYVVRDLEDEGQAAAATWNTTLKAIVPLPENIATLPAHDYTPGAQVMALYPDTTCFYRATVVSGGPGLHKLTAAKAAKKEQDLLNASYKLIFEDDGDDIKSIPAFLVVERP